MTSILTKYTWFSIGVTALAAVCGCHHIPSSQGGIGNAMGEYSIQDEETLRQWQKAATGSSRDSYDGNKNEEPNSEERFSFVKSLFKKGDSGKDASRENSASRTAYPSRQKRPDRLEDPNLFPADEYQTPQVGQTGATQTIGRVVPLNRSMDYASRSKTPTNQPVADSSRAVAFPPPPDVAAIAMTQQPSLSSTLQPENTLPENPSDFVPNGLMTTTQPAQINASAEELLAPPAGPTTSTEEDLKAQLDAENNSSSIQLASYFETAVEPVSPEALIAKAQNSLPLVDVPLDRNNALDIASATYHPILETAYTSSSEISNEESALPEKPEEFAAAALPSQTASSLAVTEPEKMSLAENGATPASSVSLSETPSEEAIPFPPVTPVPLPEATAGNSIPQEDVVAAQELIEDSPFAFLDQPSRPAAYEATRIALDSVKNLPNPSEAQSSEQWQDAVRQAVEQLRAEIDRQAEDGTLRPTEVARLQLLMLAVGDSPASVEKIASTAPTLTKFWAGQCRGLKALLDTTEENCQESVNTAARELTDSLGTLQTFCPARIEKALFSETSAAFGLYQPHRGGYHAGDIAHVYLELGNIISQPIGEEYEISIMCGWQLLDAQGNEVLEPAEQLCANRSASPLKDIVLNIPVQIPETLAAGDYQLTVAISDHHADEPETVQAVLKFKVL